jgi:hypothetical protein
VTDIEIRRVPRWRVVAFMAALIATWQNCFASLSRRELMRNCTPSEKT